jgi:hypothetical protein
VRSLVFDLELFTVLARARSLVFDLLLLTVVALAAPGGFVPIGEARQ